jgi:hypothetical protein
MLLKGGRPSTAAAEARDREDAWILHASPKFSKSHLTLAPERVAEILVEHFVGLLNLEYEMDVVDSYAFLWEEGWLSGFGPFVGEDLREARASEANFMKALENGGCVCVHVLVLLSDMRVCVRRVVRIDRGQVVLRRGRGKWLLSPHTRTHIRARTLTLTRTRTCTCTRTRTHTHTHTHTHIQVGPCGDRWRALRPGPRHRCRWSAVFVYVCAQICMCMCMCGCT